MSKTAFYFALYNADGDEKLNNEEVRNMASELFLLMNLIQVDFDSWDTISNFLIFSAEQTNTQEVINQLHEILTADTRRSDASIPLDTDYILSHLLDIHNILMGPDAAVIEVTLPSLRMILLTEDRLDQFLQTDIPRTFKLEKGLAERQKGLGQEIFEALFVEGKKLAANMAEQHMPSPNPSTSRRSLSSVAPPAIPSRSPRSVPVDNEPKEEYELIQHDV